MITNDLTGKVFTKLTVLKFLKTVNYANIWLCICDCGNEKEVKTQLLNNGHVKSCGCIKATQKPTLTHGLTGSVEHRAWVAMKTRCYNKNNVKYPNYGARGILVCKDWKKDFTIFLRDMGKCPSKNHSLDRINVDGNYEPSNCRWATDIEQGRNKTTTHYIDTVWGKISLSEAAEKSGMNYNTLKSRVRYGYTGADIFYKGNLKQL